MIGIWKILKRVEQFVLYFKYYFGGQNHLVEMGVACSRQIIPEI
jgi:hypothetical protein